VELTFRGNLKELVVSRNIATSLDATDLRTIGTRCLEDFRADKAARAEWEEWYADAMKLALQVMEEKSYPWPNCSNVKFPLLTIAALNFHARAYPTLINGNEVVNYRVIGEDKDGALAAKAKRVTQHQNFLLLEETDWEEYTDKALLVTPIMGCTFKKTYYDHDKQTVISKLVLPQELVVPYYTSSLENASRISECFSLQPNAFKTRIRRKQFLDKKYNENYSTTPEMDPMEAAKQDAQKVTATPTADADAPRQFVEQHRYLDLDGDGYAEPYIVTFVRETGEVCRIVARFNTPDIEYVDGKSSGDVVYIEPTHYYTKMPFIPSPDGGFYDLGFGMLLGPLNYAADSLINQLIDAGTMHNLGGGFLGRGVKIKRGESTFEPNEWKSVDSAGANLKDNIVPLPVRNPSQVLMDLLVFLVNYAERISGANEVQMGEIPAANIKAETMAIANSNGLKVFAAIYKRWWRATKQEFVKIYRVTSVNHDVYARGGRNLNSNEWFKMEADDYSLPPKGIWPAADPNIVSKEQKQKQSVMVYQASKETPGQDVWKATIRMYKAFDVENPEEIYPDPKGPNAIPPSPSEKMLEVQIKGQLAQLKNVEMQNNYRLAIAKMMQEAQESQARIFELYARGAEEYAKAKGVDIGHVIALIDASIAAEKHKSDLILNMVKLLKESMNVGAEQSTGSTVPSLEGAAGNPTILQLPTGSTGTNQGAMGAGQV
jgi:chaperonin GroES